MDTRLCLCLAAILGMLASRTAANPLVWDPSRRHCEMTAEKVTITVEAGKSKVRGTYQFRLGPSVEGYTATNHVAIDLPVFLRERDLAALQNGQAEPTVRVSGRNGARAAMKMKYNGLLRPTRDHPRGWRTGLYFLRIPVERRETTLTLRIEYTQPHFPGDTAAYLPMAPPKAPGSAVVTFDAAPGRQLAPAGLWSRLFSKGQSTLSFTPEDRKVLRVRSLASGGGRS